MGLFSLRFSRKVWFLMENKLIVLTHANRKRDLSHVSWAEIYIFQEYLNKWLRQQHLENTYTVRTFDIDDLETRSLETVDELFVFQTGKITSIKLIDLIKRTKFASVVLCDPNWSTEINQHFDRLITPFNELSKYTDGKSAAQTFESIAPNVHFSSYPETNYYFPFGLCYLSTHYWQMMNDRQPVMCYPLAVNADYAYVGSLKHDRIPAFEQMMSNGPVDFIGSFQTSPDLPILTSSPEYNPKTVHFQGKLPAHATNQVYQHYQALYFAPDQKMLQLDNCYERQAEFARFDGTLIPVSTDKTAKYLKESLPHYADQLQPGKWKININKLKSYYLQHFNKVGILISHGNELR